MYAIDRESVRLIVSVSKKKGRRDDTARVERLVIALKTRTNIVLY